MRACRRERGQDALAPRVACRQCEGVLAGKRRRKKRTGVCGRFRPATGLGGEGILPSLCAARRIGWKAAKDMRAYRRERGQDALAPRVGRRQCKGAPAGRRRKRAHRSLRAVSASDGPLGGGHLALHRAGRAHVVRARIGAKKFLQSLNCRSPAWRQRALRAMEGKMLSPQRDHVGGTDLIGDSTWRSVDIGGMPSLRRPRRFRCGALGRLS